MTPQRFRLLASRAALAACLSIAVVACGDDDDDDTDASAEDTGGDTGGTDDQAAGGDGCMALVDFNEMATNMDTSSASEEELMSAGEELRALWADVETVVPEELEADGEELASALDDLAAGDPTAFDADSSFETYVEVSSAVVAECGFPELEVTATDYAYDGFPETVEAGTVALHIDNQSEGEEHEIVLFKKADGETRSLEEIMEDPASEEEGPGEFAGFTFASPGEQGSGLATLTPGEYMALCFIPVGGEDDGPPHFTQGMTAEFTVE